MGITRSWTLWGKKGEGGGKGKGKRRGLMKRGRGKVGNIWRNYVSTPRLMKHETLADELSSLTG